MKEIAWFRRLLALHQLIYLQNFWPDLGAWFNAGEMVLPELLTPRFSSGVHLLGSWGGPMVWGGAVLGWLALAVFPNRVSRLSQMVLLALQLSLHHANPLIIHEPQQIANFFLIVSILWPRDPRDPSISGMRKIMIAMLAVYYLIAGLKKLPDPLWRSGEALGLLLQWSPLSKAEAPPEVFRFFLDSPTWTRLGTWFALLFELGFIFVVWTPYRRILVPIGILFHALIGGLLEVGTFGWVMMPGYCFLVRKPTWPADGFLSRARHQTGNGRG